MRGDS
jgi:putative transposase